MLTCSEVAKSISSDDYLTAGFFKRFGIRLHLLMCRYCSRYRDQLRALAAKLRAVKEEVPRSEIEAASSRVIERLSSKP